MANFFKYTQQEYKPILTEYKAIIPEKIGGIARTNKMVKISQQKQQIEDIFMNISFKAKRSENQNNERRSKRKK